MAKNSRILVISDMHHPYSHPDTIEFLIALHKKYKFDRVVCVGDEVDGHAISFHQSDPDLLAPGDELKTAIRRMQPLYRVFPSVDVLDSNHGSLVYRKGKFAGLPRAVFKSWREILEAPKGWKWHFELTIKMSDGNYVYFCHGKSAQPGKLSQAQAMSSVQGHHHEKFQIYYWANSKGLYFDMHVGCLIDDKCRAYEYNNTNLKRPLIGCGAIFDGQPRLLPMVLKKNGRWNGKVP